MTTFASALDSVEKLTLEEQEELALTIRRRVAERRRSEVVKAVAEAKREFAKGAAQGDDPSRYHEDDKAMKRVLLQAAGTHDAIY